MVRVVGVDEFGGPEVLKVFEVPEQHAGRGQVRIRVHAAAVNPTDTYTRNGDRAADPPRPDRTESDVGRMHEGRADAASSPARGGVSASALSVVQCRETAVDRDATRPSTFALCDESSILTAGWALCATIRSSLRCRSAALRGPHTGPTRYLTHLQASRTQFDRGCIFARRGIDFSAHTASGTRHVALARLGSASARASTPASTMIETLGKRRP